MYHVNMKVSHKVFAVTGMEIELMICLDPIIRFVKMLLKWLIARVSIDSNLLSFLLVEA